MSVHKAITAHSQKQHEALKRFIALDRQREQLIELAIEQCKLEHAFSVEVINQVTKEINKLAQEEVVPTRKYVTEDMITDYVKALMG